MTDEFVKNKSKELEENHTNTLENNVVNEEVKDIPDKSNTGEEVNKKLSLLEDQYKRILADYQNLQKRTAQEKEDIYKFAGQKTLEALLPALDTLDYAKEHLKPETKAEKLIEDFNLLIEMFIKCFKEIGIQTIEETGIPFDPFSHEPLQQVPTNELPPHTVIQVLKKGYILNGKIIRPALVSVSIEEQKAED